MKIANGPAPATQTSPQPALSALSVPASAHRSVAPALGAILISLMPVVFWHTDRDCHAQQPTRPHPAPLETKQPSFANEVAAQRPPPPLSKDTRPQSPIICFGGGRLAPEALGYMALWCGGRDGKIVAIGWGSEIAPRYFDLLRQGFEAFEHPPALERIPDLSEYAMRNVSAEERNQEINRKLRSATGVFLLGGDQGRLKKALRDTGAEETIRELISSDKIVLAGESAGTAIMSQNAIGGKKAHNWWEENQIKVAQGTHHFTFEGLAALPPQIIVDQHHDRPGRDLRLMEAVRKSSPASSEIVGVGVHDDSAVVVASGNVYVVGGPVGLFDGSQRIQIDAGGSFSLAP